MEVIFTSPEGCLPTYPGLLPSVRRFRLVIVIMIAVIVYGGTMFGVTPAAALLTVSGIVAASAAVSRFVLDGFTPAAKA